MKSNEAALQDIEFIKQLMARNRKKLDHSPPFLFIWGSYLLVGFIGMQVDTEVWPAWYWSIATIVCSLLSAYAGIRLSKRASRSPGGTYSWMFWLPFLVVMLSGVFMMAGGIVKQDYISLMWLNLTGIVYVSMGPLLGRGPVVIGIWFLVLSVIIRLFFLDYQFLLLGLLAGGSMIGTGLVMLVRRRRHG